MQLRFMRRPTILTSITKYETISIGQNDIWLTVCNGQREIFRISLGRAYFSVRTRSQVYSNYNDREMLVVRKNEW